MTTVPFSFERHARTRTTALVVVLVWLALAVAWFWLEAAGWVLRDRSNG